MFLMIALVLIPLVAGYVANLVVGKNAHFQAWELYIAGIIGSFVGGLILNLLFNGNLELSISGLVGSTIGAIIVLGVWAWVRVKRLGSNQPG